MPVKLSDREKILVIATLAFAVFFVFFQFLLTPKWSEITKVKDALRNERLTLKIAEGKIKILDAIKKVASSELLSVKSRDEMTVEILDDISRATAKSGLDLTSIKPVSEMGGTEIKFELSGTGNYRELYDFLVIISRLRAVVLIDALNVSRAQDAGAELNISMTLVAYL